MKPDGHGKAKVLTDAQMDLLFDEGFTCPRDRAFYGVSRYTGARPFEVKKANYSDFFQKDQVRERILFRKKNTKGQQGTRTMKAHRNLVTYLEEYRQASLELLELKRTHINWTHLGFRKDFIQVECPKCNSTKTTRHGLARYKLIKQIYECKNCGFHFTSSQIVDGENIESRYISLDSCRHFGVKNSTTFGLLFLDEKILTYSLEERVRVILAMLQCVRSLKMLAKG